MIPNIDLNSTEGKVVFLTVQEVSQILSVSSSTVRSWINDGQLNALRYRRAIRIRSNDLDVFVQKFTTSSAEGVKSDAY